MSFCTLLGKKSILNELLAYLDLNALIDNSAGDAAEGITGISDRVTTIAAFSLCGFADLSPHRHHRRGHQRYSPQLSERPGPHGLQGNSRWEFDLLDDCRDSEASLVSFEGCIA